MARADSEVNAELVLLNVFRTISLNCRFFKLSEFEIERSRYTTMDKATWDKAPWDKAKDTVTHLPGSPCIQEEVAGEGDPAVIFMVNERRMHDAMALLAGSDGGTITLIPPLRQGKQNILLLGN